MLASPLVGSVAAKDGKSDPKALREQANKIRRNAGQKAWKKYLQSQGCGLASVETGLSLDKSDGVSTQGFDNVDGSSSDCDICLDFTLYHDIYGNYNIDMYWTYDSEKWTGGGGYSPHDGLGLYFDPQQWDFEFDTLTGTSYTSNKDIVSVEDDSIYDGLPFSVYDAGTGDDTAYWAGIYITPVGDYSPSERYVYGEYLHTWNVDYTNYSMSVSYPGGVSMSFDTSETVITEPTGTEGDGNTLMKLNQNQSDPV